MAKVEFKKSGICLNTKISIEYKIDLLKNELQQALTNEQGRRNY
jgi:hypothetical protein